MQFNVSQLLREPVGSTRHYTIEPEPPIHRGSVQLTRVPGGVLVHGEADLILDANCSRCVAAFGYPEHIAFDEIFVQQVDVASGTRLDSADQAEEGSFFVLLDHSIDITEAVRQYSEVAAAMQPLCRPDCPGLCPECGQDLNLEPCRCETSAVDPRWGALSALKRANG
jgi:uncharacterized protein